MIIGENDLTRDSAQPTKTVLLVTCGCPKCNPMAMDKKAREKLLSNLQIREQDCLFYVIGEASINALATNGVATKVCKVLRAEPSIRAASVYATTDCERDQGTVPQNIRQQMQAQNDEKNLHAVIRHQQTHDMLIGMANFQEEVKRLDRSVGITLFHHDRTLGPYPKRLQV